MQENLRVLAVDDDMINLKLLKSLLIKTGKVTEVIEAKNGEEAIDALKMGSNIDLVLLDIIMPIMNGLEVIKVVRADENLHQVPIIVLTTDETKKSEALDLGANEFLMKPIRKDELIKKISSVLL